MTLNQLVLFSFGLLAATFAALSIARRYRERRDAALTATSGGWRIRSQLPIDPGYPYGMFDELTFTGAPWNIMEGEEEGFSVYYFESYVSRGQPGPGAIVVLPVQGPPPFLKHEDAALPPGIGTATAEALGQLGHLRIRLVPYALYARSYEPNADAVQRGALQLAKAIVADAGADAGRTPSLSSGSSTF